MNSRFGIRILLMVLAVCCYLPAMQALDNSLNSNLSTNPFVNNFSVTIGQRNGAGAPVPVDPSVRSDIESGGGLWNQACGSEIPGFTFPGPNNMSSVPVSVIYHDSLNIDTCPEACGCVLTVEAGGLMISAEVHIFKGDSNKDCTGIRKEMAAHEFGHVLGFENACGVRIMGVTIPGTKPEREECDMIDFLWYTVDEFSEDGGGGFGTCD